MQEFFDFKITNKKFGFFYSLLSNILNGIIICVPILIALVYADTIIDLDIFGFIPAIIFFTELIIVIIGEIIYFKTRKGVKFTDEGIVVYFGTVGYGFEPMTRKIKYDNIKDVIVTNKSTDSKIQHVAGGNYKEDYVVLFFRQKR